MQSFQGSHSWIWQGWCQDDAGAQRLIPEVEHAAFLDILADAKKNTMQANVMKAEGLLAHGILHHKTKQGLTTLQGQLAQIAGGQIPVSDICPQLKSKAESLVN